MGKCLFRVVRKGLLHKMVPLGRDLNEVREQGVQTSGSVLDRGNGKCKGHENGSCWACLRNSMEARMAGTA